MILYGFIKNKKSALGTTALSSELIQITCLNMTTNTALKYGNGPKYKGEPKNSMVEKTPQMVKHLQSVLK